MNSEHKPLFDKLTRLQKGVCLGVLEGKPYATAYRDAGGIAKTGESAKAIVSRMLTDVNVKAFMGAADEQAISDAVMTRREALERLSWIAVTSVADLVEFSTVDVVDTEGVPHKQSIWALKDGAAQTPEALAALAELSATKEGFKFKTHSAPSAIKELSAMLGWEAPKKLEHTGKDGEKLEFGSDREFARALAHYFTKGAKE